MQRWRRGSPLLLGGGARSDYRQPQRDERSRRASRRCLAARSRIVPAPPDTLSQEHWQFGRVVISQIPTILTEMPVSMTSVISGAPGADTGRSDDDEPIPLDPVDSETADQDAALPFYEVLTYPADYTLEVLVDKWRKNEIVVPKFQRRFVWNLTQSSRLIDSFLKGLPVPSIFLYQDLTSPELVVVDGQQRLKTIAYYFSGHFGDGDEGPRREFCLAGLEEGNPFEGLSYAGLRELHPTAFAKLNNSVLRAFLIRQFDPADDTSIYHVFERLNTGGTQLLPQEIRNCVHYGPFNDMLIELNDNADWRRIFGDPTPDKRQRDVEMILRCFALMKRGNSYKKPMKNFLNRFMASQSHLGDSELDAYRNTFTTASALVLERLGERPFHIRRSGLNAAVLDCIFSAIAQNAQAIPPDLPARYKSLVTNQEFLDCVTSGTTDQDVVTRRITLATEAFGWQRRV